MLEPEARLAAVDQAYRDHADDLYRVAFGILRDVDAAVDATQVAFARAFERWGQYDPRRPLLPWLHGIVIHEALDAVRRARVRHVAVATTGGGSGTTSFEGDVAARVADRAAIAAGLAQLKPAARAAVVLYDVYGYDYAEIGRMLGTSPGNVGSTLTRAHARLREALTTTEASPDAAHAVSPHSLP